MTLNAKGGTGRNNPDETFIPILRGSFDQEPFEEIAPTLNAHFGDKQGLEDQHIRGGQDSSCVWPEISMPCMARDYKGPRNFQDGGLQNSVVVGGSFDSIGLDEEQNAHIEQMGCLKARTEGGGFEGVVAHTLRGEGFDASEDGCGCGTPIIPQAFYSTESRCDNLPEPGVAPPLKVGSNGGGQPPAIAFSAKYHGADAAEDCSPTLRAGGFDKSHANSGNWVAIAENQRGELRTSDVSPQLSCPGGKPGSGYPAVAFQEAQTGCREYDTAGTLRADGPGHDPVGTRLRAGMSVRRLVPRECERLQGMDDDWTLVPYRGKPAADGPRYKAIGNSWAVPVLNWIAQRIMDVEAIK